MPATIGELVERYRIEAQLEVGGFHYRYRARHEHIGTLFLLVEIAFHERSFNASGQLPDAVSNERTRERFRDSCRLQARVRHRNVLRVTDRFERDGTPWLVEEYTEGLRLGEFVELRPLTIAENDAIAAGLFAGVGALHARGILHRDLKPQNVWVATEGGRLLPQVTSFALACAADVSSKGDRGSVSGTPPFMSPEQTTGLEACRRGSDLWSLAGTLYVAATGKLPFDAPWEPGDFRILFDQIRSGTYGEPQRHRADIPDRWRRAFAAAFTVDPTARVGTVTDLSHIWFDGAAPSDAGPLLTAPAGDVTLLFTDVEGSTSLWERMPELARECLLPHDAVLRETLLRYGGYEVKTKGDAFMVAFARPEHALRCAVDVQAALASQPWSARLADQPEAKDERGLRGLRVRMGIHRCTPEPRPDGAGRMDYFGPGVNRAARIMSAAHGGQVLVDAETLAACGEAIGSRSRSVGSWRLKGIAAAVELVEVWSEAASSRDFPPPRASSPEPAP